MKNHIFVFLTLVLLSESCSRSSSEGETKLKRETGPAISEVKVPSVPEEAELSQTGQAEDPDNVPISNLPPAALTFESNITLVNLTPEQEEKYNKAIEITKLVIGTEEFREKVLNYTYNGVKSFADNGGKTNDEIYQSILD